MARIYYEIRGGDGTDDPCVAITPCPKDKRGKVGSMGCYRCPCNRFINTDCHYVICGMTNEMQVAQRKKELANI